MLAPVSPDIAPELILRDPAAALQTLRSQWQAEEQRGRCSARWIFGYASLIWRPDFDAAEQRPAWLRGWHRALAMRSRVNRGSATQPGLVFALLPGGSCKGVAYRLRAEQAETELDRLWQREMPTGVYDARLLPCHTAQGPVLALAFTLSRRSAACWLDLSDAELTHILRHARGRYGTTLQYLTETAAALRARGTHDRKIERLMALAREQGLL